MAEITVTPSGTISTACGAAEPCHTPSVRVALPLTAAAVGTVQSTRSCPSSRPSRRLLRFSDWALNGTARKTIGPRRAASTLTDPSALAPGTARTRRSTASWARSALREPITTDSPARARRIASPQPRAPVPPTMGIGSDMPAQHMLRRMRLEGRRALVTGGASGIGAAISRRLAAEAAEVVISDVNAEGAREVAAEIGAEAAALDVTDATAAAQVVASAGPFEILINNAGTDDFAFFTDMDPERWRRLLAINLEGVFACTHAVLPAMQEAGYGRIVNIASE